MLKSQKQDLVSKMQTDLKKAGGAIFLDFTGLTVAEANDLRKVVRNEGKGKITYRVLKNTLLKRAMDGTTFADAANFLKGTPTGVVFGEDPVATAKMTFDFLKNTEHLKVKGGVVDAKAINSKQTEALSKMPGRLELLGRIIATAKSPGAKLMSQVKSPGSRIAGAVKALVEKLEKAGA
jgi:large subunit ribosomal protein L10